MDRISGTNLYALSIIITSGKPDDMNARALAYQGTHGLDKMCRDRL